MTHRVIIEDMMNALTFVVCTVVQYYPYLSDCQHRVIPQPDRQTCVATKAHFNEPHLRSDVALERARTNNYKKIKDSDIAKRRPGAVGKNGIPLATTRYNPSKFYLKPDPKNPLRVGDTVFRDYAECEKVYAPLEADPMLSPVWDSEGDTIPGATKRVTPWETHPAPHPSHKNSI